jgi:hypothetical protein
MSTTGPALPPQNPPPTPLPGTIRRGDGLPMRRPVAWLIILVLVFVIVFSLTRHRETKQEQLVTRIILSVQHNDMSPVRNDFDTPARDSMTHEKVGHLADLLSPMGKLKSVDETTPKDAGSRHTYIAHFERGDWEVIMPLDSNGKAEGFYMRRMQQ